MRIALIVAMARNRVIGRDNALPWHLPGDLRHFKTLTLGKPLIMGRRTYESIGRPLPGRTNIVISSRADFRVPEGVLLVHDIDAALLHAAYVAERDRVDECMVIGGARVYADCMERAERIYMSLIDADVAGDTEFPPCNEASWREVSRVVGDSGAAGGLPYWFIVLERNKAIEN